jgi:hypothetical protein
MKNTCFLTAGFLALCYSTPTAISAQQQGTVRVERSEIEKFRGRSTLRKVNASRVETLPPNVNSVTLSPGEFLETTAKDSVSVDSSGPTTHLDLQYRYLGATKTGDLTSLSIAIEKSSGGLLFDPGRGVYEAVLSIGLDDSLHPDETANLQSPIRMTVSAGVDTVLPHDLVLDHTNLPFEPVRLVVSTPGDSVPLHLRPSFSKQGQVVWLRVYRPRLLVAVSPLKINGWGLETATITVGEPLNVGNWPIILNTDRGTLDSTRISVSADRPAVISLRSMGLGVATIRAIHPQFRMGRAQVRFVFPLGFLIAAAIGGLIGAAISAIKGQNKASGQILVALAAVLTGLVAAALYAVGVNVTGFDIKVQFGETATFLIATLAGLAGPTILTPRAKT